jgi:class 3 adenylate cyclase/tetratricopeptide (TPR) repeat protein
MVGYVSQGRFDARVRDLLDEAEEALSGGDGATASVLARAALTLQADDQRALDVLARAEPHRAAGGERRQLTVMFCDVVGSTRLAQDHDPELVREVLRAYQATCDEAVRRYEGRIARYIGDGVLAYFGHPIAHEDDARRAVKAGLDLLQALRPVTEEVGERYGIDLEVRVAVHTGLVVVADMGSAATPDHDAIVGETPNLAARLQDHAPPGTIAISQATYDLVRGWFLVAPLGALELRGLSEPVTAYQVVEETAIESRVQAQVDLSPFVGRGELLDELYRAWAEVRAGGSMAIVLRGQPGVGKSRLADLLRRRVQADEGGTAIANCSAYNEATALFPVRRLLERAAGIDAHQAPERAHARLWSVLEAAGQVESVPLLADLLELPPTDWSPPPELDGARRHAAVLAALVSFVAASAARTPLLLVVDDIQWADPSTNELIGRIVSARLPGLLVVMTAREEVRPAWPSARVIDVDRLSAEELHELARRLPESRHLTPDDVQRAIERSDGIPFFLEELLRSSGMARGDGVERATRHIPAGLRDLLLARFAAPGVDLRLAQLLSAIGDESSAPVVAAIAGCPLAELDDLLAPMVAAGILVREEGEPVMFRFRHHLLAELAYDTQLRESRERAHSTIADALRSEASVGVASAPAVVARHLEQAQRIDEAIEALLEAAREAYELGANEEVGELLTRGLELLPSASPERQHGLEFRLRIQRGTAVASTLGFSAPQAVADFETCRALAEAAMPDGLIDDLDGVAREQASELVSANIALWGNVLLQGRVQDADEINQSLLARFHPEGKGYLFTEAVGGSFSCFFRGRWSACLERFEDVVRISGEYELPGVSPMPNDGLTSALTHVGFAHAIGGCLEDARSIYRDAMTLAEGFPFPVGPFTVCYALGMRAVTELVYGELDAARAAAAELCGLADRHGFTFWSLFGGLYEAMGAFADGDREAGDRAGTMILLLRATGVLVWVPPFLSILAEVHLAQGDHEAARPLLEQARDVAAETDAHFWTAEVTRQLGLVGQAAGDPVSAALLRAAVDLAVEQGAALFELRARTALHRHHPADDEERARLVALLERLPLPADTPDRRAAEALLANG